MCSTGNGEGTRTNPEGRRRDHNVRSTCSPRTDGNAHGADAGSSQGPRSSQALRTGSGCSSLTHQASRTLEGQEVREGTRPQAQLWLQEVDDDYQRAASSFVLLKTLGNLSRDRFFFISLNYARYMSRQLRNVM